MSTARPGTAATYETWAAGPMFYEEDEDGAVEDARMDEALRRHAKKWHAENARLRELIG